MKILLDFNSSITKKNSKKLGGIESLNIGLFNNLKSTFRQISLKYKNKKIYFNNISKNKNYHCIYIIFKKNIRSNDQVKNSIRELFFK